MPFSPGSADLAMSTMVDIGQAWEGHPRHTLASERNPNPHPQHAAGDDLPSRCVHRWGFSVCVFLVRGVRSPKEPRSAQKILHFLTHHEAIAGELGFTPGNVPKQELEEWREFRKTLRPTEAQN